ncbi:MAG: protein kinase, partial [Phycisphaerae bacterium]
MSETGSAPREQRRDSDLIAAARKQIERADSGPPSRDSDARTPLASNPFIGPRLGSYDFVREIERGGQGVVYEAVHKGTHRTVAVKVSREGPFAGRRDRERFSREGEILATLDHPNIVAIHDSGRELGCQYFVMDFVDGQSLDQWIARRRPDVSADRARQRAFVRESLELFAIICEAVNAAHLSGVVHRDLKPTNIRVTEKGVPKILDFGLAKQSFALGRPGSSAAASLTQTGQFVGTLPYASPEQAAGAACIDTRTDVYSLGVMFYQLLTGAYPYDVSGAPNEVTNRILSVAPRSPTLHNHDIDSEVSTILLRALAKEPERRYQTAGELAREMRRYLAGEPIEARRDSTIYVVRKHLARHKGAVAIAAAFAMTVVAGLGISLMLWRQAVSERDRAITAEQREQRNAKQLATALAAETEARDLAETRRATAEARDAETRALHDFFRDMIAGSNPSLHKGRQLSVREMLDNSVEQLIAKNLESEPELSANMYALVADAYLNLGEYADAITYFRRALELRESFFGPTAAATLISRNSLSRSLIKSGAISEGMAVAEETAKNLETAENVPDMYRAEAMFSFGVALREMDQLARSQELLENAIKLLRNLPAEERTSLGPAINALGVLHLRQKRYADAEAAFAEALPLIESSNEFMATELPVIINNYGSALYYQAKFAEAEEMLNEAYRILRSTLGDEHPNTLASANN